MTTFRDTWQMQVRTPDGELRTFTRSITRVEQATRRVKQASDGLTASQRRGIQILRQARREMEKQRAAALRLAAAQKQQRATALGKFTERAGISGLGESLSSGAALGAFALGTTLAGSVRLVTGLIQTFIESNEELEEQMGEVEAEGTRLAATLGETIVGGAEGASESMTELERAMRNVRIGMVELQELDREGGWFNEARTGFAQMNPLYSAAEREIDKVNAALERYEEWANRGVTPTLQLSAGLTAVAANAGSAQRALKELAEEQRRIAEEEVREEAGFIGFDAGEGFRERRRRGGGGGRRRTKATGMDGSEISVADMSRFRGPGQIGHDGVGLDANGQQTNTGFTVDVSDVRGSNRTSRLIEEQRQMREARARAMRSPELLEAMDATRQAQEIHELNQAFEDFGNRGLATFSARMDEALQSALTGRAGLSGFGKALTQDFGQLLVDLGSQTVSIASIIEIVKSGTILSAPGIGLGLGAGALLLGSFFGGRKRGGGRSAARAAVDDAARAVVDAERDRNRREQRSREENVPIVLDGRQVGEWMRNQHARESRRGLDRLRVRRVQGV